MKMNKLTLIALAIGFVFTACTSDDTTTVVARGDYENGIIITEEGNFSNGNGAVTYVSNDLNTVENTIFNNVNNRTLGNLVQSMSFIGNLGYIIVNGSNEIEIVDRYTFESISTIDTGLSNPRYMAIVNGKGYITNWGDGGNATDDYVAVLNLTTNSFEAPIPVAEGPEELVVVGNKIYVAHKGGFSQNNIVSVINTASNEVSSTITVGDVPNTLQVDNVGNVWVLCEGKPSWTGDETAGKLAKINVINNTVTTIDFPVATHPKHLYFANNNLYYYLNGGLYKMTTTSTTLPTTPEFSGVNFYDFSVRGNQLFGLDNNSFSASESFLKVYDLTTNTETNSFNLGPFAGEVYFN